ncbi:hypothetical protein C9374_001098 [Naegleria lovaniensis]|uniref:Uncharacterized protein n=1 Tax=Naegleria lovaniensis TaxID=51637 RepID=A0AA88KN14_NAELO|nr:uncharacterized protein C9374_001098 [Naegleria lovaniensis]KAG2387504.1 hypothetical protein C9374_001098 [Naegleria lovaniensis]
MSILLKTLSKPRTNSFSKLVLPSLQQVVIQKENTRHFSQNLSTFYALDSDNYSDVNASLGGGGYFGAQRQQGYDGREHTFEEQYAAKKDFELLLKMASDFNKKHPSLRYKDIFEKMKEKHEAGEVADLTHIIHDLTTMKPDANDDTLGDTHVANVDVQAKGVSQFTDKPLGGVFAGKSPKVPEEKNPKGVTVPAKEERKASDENYPYVADLTYEL